MPELKVRVGGVGQAPSTGLGFDIMDDAYISKLNSALKSKSLIKDFVQLPYLTF